MAVERGCGSREEGGIYMVLPLGPGGRPVDDFLVCPPVPIYDPAGAGISAIGVSVVDDPGEGRVIHHVVDWVGSQHYPNVTDFVEETRRFGISRRLPKTFPFGSLTAESQMILLHARAYITNWEGTVAALRLMDMRSCPLNVFGHPLSEMCAALWWEDVRPHGDDVTDASRPFLRTMPAFTYEARQPPIHTEHALAIFARFPIARLEVIADPNGGTHEDALDKIGRCTLPVAVVKE